MDTLGLREAGQRSACTPPQNAANAKRLARIHALRRISTSLCKSS
jgi:hypothetical protein